MHHHDVAGAVAMWVCVLLGGPSVSGPARVSNAISAIHRVGADSFFQVPELALRPSNRQLAAVFEHGDPRGVVSPILQPAKPIQNYGHRFALSDVPNNSAHTISG